MNVEEPTLHLAGASHASCCPFWYRAPWYFWSIKQTKNHKVRESTDSDALQTRSQNANPPPQVKMQSLRGGALASASKTNSAHPLCGDRLLTMCVQHCTYKLEHLWQTSTASGWLDCSGSYRNITVKAFGASPKGRLCCSPQWMGRIHPVQDRTLEVRMQAHRQSSAGKACTTYHFSLQPGWPWEQENNHVYASKTINVKFRPVTLQSFWHFL